MALIGVALAVIAAVIVAIIYPNIEIKTGSELYFFERDGLTVIQVGSPDECPRFIAYR